MSDVESIRERRTATRRFSCMRRAYFVTALLLVMLASGASTTATTTCRAQSRPTNSQPHMKGYELWSWQAVGKGGDGDWYFSLLAGTNRLKTRGEITSRRTRLKGVGALRRALRGLPAGAEVFWSTRGIPRMRLPPREMIEELRDYCRERGIELRV